MTTLLASPAAVFFLIRNSVEEELKSFVNVTNKWPNIGIRIHRYVNKTPSYSTNEYDICLTLTLAEAAQLRTKLDKMLDDRE
jgi:hypothetical protein